MYNSAGFLDDYAPIFDPAQWYHELHPAHAQDLRINNQLLGEAMAGKLSSHDGVSNGLQHFPDHSCVLLRGNGMVVCGDSLECTVHKTIHLDQNADIQTDAMSQRTNSDLPITYLTPTETKDSEKSMRHLVPLIWDAWVVKTERSGLYKNEVG